MTQSRADALALRPQQEGLLDVVYTSVDAPFGALEVAATPQGVVRVAFASERLDEVLQELADTVSPRVIESPARLDGVRRELDEYFSGTRRSSRRRLTGGSRTDSCCKAREACYAIPFGEVRTYAELAGPRGSPKAVRAAGNAMARNPIPIIVPATACCAAAARWAATAAARDQALAAGPGAKLRPVP